jgi:hypothetical protein
MLDHNTGNAWLDVGEINLAVGGGYPEWSRENNDWLGEEWRTARPVLDGVLSLLNWRNENAPRQWCREAVGRSRRPRQRE